MLTQKTITTVTTTRLAGHVNQYHVLKVYADGEFTGEVHTSKDMGYLKRLTDAIIRGSKPVDFYNFNNPIPAQETK